MRRFLTGLGMILFLGACTDPGTAAVNQIRSAYEKALGMMEAVEGTLGSAGDAKAATEALKRYNQVQPEVEKQLQALPRLEEALEPLLEKEVKPVKDKMAALSQKLLSTLQQANLKFADDPEYARVYMESLRLRP